jgi:uncharacterized membrane protein YfcA
MIDLPFVVAGAFTGLVVGLTGVGGGALMTPILILFFGVAPATAVATDLWFAPLTKIAAVAIHYRTGNVDWQVVRRLWAGSIPVAIAVVLVMALGFRVERIDWLTKAIGVVVAVTAVGLLAAPALQRLTRERRIAEPVRFKKRQGALTVLAGGTLGLLVALTSVGAGALGTVMLLAIYPLRMTPHRLVATDIAHAIPLAMVAGTGYLFAGMVNGAMLGSLLVGSIPAVIAGSLLAQRFSPGWLRVALAVVLIATAVKTLSV